MTGTNKNSKTRKDIRRVPTKYAKMNQTDRNLVIRTAKDFYDSYWTPETSPTYNEQKRMARWNILLNDNAKHDEDPTAHVLEYTDICYALIDQGADIDIALILSGALDETLDVMKVRSGNGDINTDDLKNMAGLVLLLTTDDSAFSIDADEAINTVQLRKLKIPITDIAAMLHDVCSMLRDDRLHDIMMRSLDPFIYDYKTTSLRLSSTSTSALIDIGSHKVLSLSPSDLYYIDSKVRRILIANILEIKHMLTDRLMGTEHDDTAYDELLNENMTGIYDLINSDKLTAMRKDLEYARLSLKKVPTATAEPELRPVVTGGITAKGMESLDSIIRNNIDNMDMSAFTVMVKGLSRNATESVIDKCSYGREWDETIGFIVSNDFRVSKLDFITFMIIPSGSNEWFIRNMKDSSLSLSLKKHAYRDSISTCSIMATYAALRKFRDDGGKIDQNLFDGTLRLTWDLFDRLETSGSYFIDDDLSEQVKLFVTAVLNEGDHRNIMRRFKFINDVLKDGFKYRKVRNWFVNGLNSPDNHVRYIDSIGDVPCEVWIVDFCS